MLKKKSKQVYRIGCFYLRVNILDIKFIVDSEDLKTQLPVLGSVISTNYCLLSII